MFPLPVTVIGCGGDLLQVVRMELSVIGARIEADFLGVESAINEMRSAESTTPRAKTTTPTSVPPRLFVVNIDSVQELNSIKRLSSFFPGSPILVLMSVDRDPTIPIQALRMGASQVVNLPLQVDDFKLALDCIGEHFGGNASGASQVIAIAGVTGGCGVTALAINVAYEIAQLNKNRRVILAELSLGLGKLPLYLNIEPRHTTADLLKDIHRLDLYFVEQALTQVEDNFSILSGPLELPSCSHASVEDILMLIESLRHMADVVVLDVPCTYNQAYFETLTAADKVLLVSEQTVPSVRSLQMVREMLGNRPVHAVLNRYHPRLKSFDAANLSELAKVQDVLTICSDYPAVSRAIDAGVPVRLKSPRSRVVADYRSVAMHLAPPEGAASTKTGDSGGLLKRLMRSSAT